MPYYKCTAETRVKEGMSQDVESPAQMMSSQGFMIAVPELRPPYNKEHRQRGVFCFLVGVPRIELGLSPFGPRKHF